MSGQHWCCDSPKTWDFFIAWCEQQKHASKDYVLSIRKKKRTDRQNKAEHVYFELLADALNGAGYDQKAVFEAKEVGVPWSATTVKENLWRPIQIALFDIESTTDLSTVETREVYVNLDKITSEKFGVHVPWPQKKDEGFYDSR